MKEKNKGLPEKTKGTRAEEKKQRLRGEMKGADSAKGEMHEEIVKCEREIKDYGGRIQGTRAQKEMQMSRWETKGADSAKGRYKMHDRENEI